MRINAPGWTKWEGKQIETSLGDIRQWSNQTVISFSILNASDQPVEVVPPQIQISGRAVKKKKEGRQESDCRSAIDSRVPAEHDKD